MSPQSSIVARLRTHPVATTIELGSVLLCVLLAVWTVGLLAGGPPRRNGWSWLLLVGTSAMFVLFWTVFVPLYERTLE
jgi:hypothetical protein